jgi:hypothetical protein
MPRIKIRFKNGKAEEYDHKEYDMPDEIPLTATNFSITNRANHNVTIFSMDTIEKIEIVGFPKKTLHNFTE